MLYIFKSARPSISLFQLLKSFVHSKMGTGDMIMYIKQNFVLHRLGNHELRKTFTSATFLATIETIQLTVLNDVKTIYRLLTRSFFWLSHRCWAKCHPRHNLSFHLTLDICAVFNGFHLPQDHSTVRR